jgi:hypothetical protein
VVGVPDSGADVAAQRAPLSGPWSEVRKARRLQPSKYPSVIGEASRAFFRRAGRLAAAFFAARFLARAILDARVLSKSAYGPLRYVKSTWK